MTQREKEKDNKWIRHFTVDETAKHKEGFTIYKINSVIFPIDSPEILTESSVWKRYSEIEKLHKSMSTLHSALHLKGKIPTFKKWNYFKRFDEEVITDRKESIKCFLDFVGDHRLLFTSAEFVNFLKSGYPEPVTLEEGIINSIRSSLQLPAEDMPPLQYENSDGDQLQNIDNSENSVKEVSSNSDDLTKSCNGVSALTVADIKIFEAETVEMKNEKSPTLKKNDSFASLSSLESTDSNLFDEVMKIKVDDKCNLKDKVENTIDLIKFDAKVLPSSSSDMVDHNLKEQQPDTSSESLSLNSTMQDSLKSVSRTESWQSLFSKRSFSTISGLNLDPKTKSEESYVFEAGYMFNLAGRCEDMGDYARAFECYKDGIEKMLIGVQTDTNMLRKSIVKEKTTKYLTYAEYIHKTHLSGGATSVFESPEEWQASSSGRHQLPASMLKRPYEELALYRCVALLDSAATLVVHKEQQQCYAMKVLQKIPNNLPSSAYFTKRTNDTKQPILPTNVPYMVQLYIYVETTNLIFLILHYAPGGRLFDYISNYVKSETTTKAGQVNLGYALQTKLGFARDMDNLVNKVFKADKPVISCDNESDLKKASEETKVMPKSDLINNLQIKRESLMDDSCNVSTAKESVKTELDSNGKEVSLITVNELLDNSQRLLNNIEIVLSHKHEDISEETKDEINCNSFKNEAVAFHEENSVAAVGVNKVNEAVLPPLDLNEKMYNKKSMQEVTTNRVRAMRKVLSPNTICKWGAELLTAIEGLHCAGVILRDLEPDNLLLGDGGHLLVTYFVGYNSLDVVVSMVEKKIRDGVNMYLAPELYHRTFLDTENEAHLDKACDFWSFGAIMYEMICGVPLSHFHRSVFTSHTLLQFPEPLPADAESLLTQLLYFEPAQRLGGGKEGIEEIKTHPYFKQVDWKSIVDDWIPPD